MVHKRERKVTFMVMLMIASFLSAWMGYALVCFLRLIGVDVATVYVAISLLSAKMGGLLNAIVFIFMNTQVSQFSFSPNFSTLTGIVKWLCNAKMP